MIRGSNGNLYVSDPGAASIAVFTYQDVEPPTVAIDPVPPASYASTHVTGTVNPRGFPLTTSFGCMFEFVTEAQFQATGFTGAATTRCANDPGSASTDFPVEADITHLHGGTKYHVRLSASNPGGTTVTTEPNPTFETKEVALPDVTLEAPNAVSDTGARFTAQIDPNAPGSAPQDEAFDARWRFECHPGCPGLEGTVLADNSIHGIEANAQGLEPNTEYTVKLVVENAGGVVEASEIAGQPVNFKTTAPAPTAIDSTNVPHSDSEVLLRAFVNPHNSTVSDCHFAYGPTMAYGQSAPCEGAPSGGNSLIEVTAKVSGLTPATLYHYNLVLTTDVDTTETEDRVFAPFESPVSRQCPNEEIRLQQEATRLPNCMAYELVSPTDQLGSDPDAAYGSNDGNHAWIRTTIPMNRDANTGNFSTLESVRTSSGWRQRELGVAGTNDIFALQIRSADSSRALLLRCPGVLIGCDGYVKLERVDSDGSRSVVFDQEPFTLGAEPPTPLATSDDLSRVVIGTNGASTPPLPEDTHSQGRGLYLSNQGQLEYIGRDENGDVLPCGAVLANGRGGGGFQQDGISADGSTIVYEGPDREAQCSEPVDVYVRRNGETFNASAPRNGNPDEGAIYLGNSRDGDTVYFLTKSQLVGSDSDGLADIHAYDVPSDSLTRITPGADVQDAVVAPNGKYVYFNSFKSITGQGIDGELNLFVYHSGEIDYVTTARDGVFTLGGYNLGPNTSPVTPDGKHLLFAATAALSGRPLNGTRQLFSYDVETDALSCVSCPTDDSALSFEALLLEPVSERGLAL